MTGYLFRQNLWKNRMSMNRKALFLDMDGTTLDDKSRMSDENIQALAKAIEAGHEVVITTGRPMASAKLLLNNYGLDKIGCRYVIAFNGGMVLDAKKGEVLFQQTIPLSQMKEMIMEARRQGVYIQTYEGEIVLSESEDENLRHYVGKNGMTYQVVPDLAEALQEEPCKALAIDIHSPKPLEEYAAKMADWAADKIDMYLSCREYLEVVPKGICKGKAITAFCERLGIPVENAIAAGDEQNDISMLEVAGVGCAVANAQPEVIAAADYVTERDNNHSAVAEIVEKFVFGR